MFVLEEMKRYGHEKIVFGRDEETGLAAIVAIHSTVLGPAVGGTRFWNYDSEEAALFDVLRLSRGMTMKNAAAGLQLGGGKAVIIGDPQKLKSRAFFHAYGRLIDSLGGCYYTAEDMNIGAQDVAYIHEATRYVTGTPEISGNPSPFTARGVFNGLRAGAKVAFGADDLSGKTVVVQGLGSVGYSLCEMLSKEGAVLKVYDLNAAAVEKAVRELGATAISAGDVLTDACDIFAPCAMGAVLNTDNVHQLKCKLIAGAANNVLMDDAAGDALEELGILYMPDFIINAGGIINCGMEVTEKEYSADVVNQKVDAIYNTSLEIVAISRKRGIGTYQAANEYAMGVIEAKKQNILI